MTDINNNKPCYIPLSLTSQCNGENVLFYNANAPLDSIYGCAIGRLQAAINLADSLKDLNEVSTNTLNSFTEVISLLLNDCYTLLEELNPVAVKLRDEYKHNRDNKN